MAFCGVEGMLETAADSNEALVHLFVDKIGVSCIFIFLRSLDKGMLSSESLLGMWTMGMGDSGNSWSGVDILTGSIGVIIVGDWGISFFS